MSASRSLRLSGHALLLIAALAFHAFADGGGRVHDQSGLTVTIVPAKDKAGKLIIDRQGGFQVVFANQSEKPIQLWSEEFRLGHETLSFRYDDEDGQSRVMSRNVADPSSWKNVPLKTITIEPGGTVSWTVNPHAFFCGHYDWNDVPEPNTGKGVKIRAVFDIGSTDAAKKLGVWTGRGSSMTIWANSRNWPDHPAYRAI